MSAANTVFKVLTEFQFEVAGAVANAGILERAAGKVSDTAQGALNSISKLASTLTSSMGVSIGGLSILAGAISASEKFTQNQLSFSNLISSNLDVMTGDVGTFNDRLAVSEKVLKNIAMQASKFSLDENALLSTSKMLSAMLAPKGLAGNNFGASIDLARNFEKSAPTLGVDTFESQGQLVRMIEGQATMGDTLFRRLLMETKAFGSLKSQGGSATKNFNQLDLTKRFALIQEAMGQFASDADVLSGNANLLSNQLTRLKNIFTGLNGILKPLGDVIVPQLKMGLRFVTDIIDTQGRRIVESFSKFLTPLVANPDQIYTTLKQLSTLRQDLQDAGRLASLAGLAGLAFHLAKFAWGFTAFQVAVVGAAKVVGMGGLLATLGGIKAAGFALKNIVPIVSVLARVIGFVARIGFIVGFFTALFQVIERAKAIADISNVKFLIDQSGNLAEKLLEVGDHLRQFMAPLFVVFDDIARLIAPMFEIESYAGIASGGLDLLGGSLEWVSDKVITVGGAVYGLGSAMASIAFDLSENMSLVLKQIGQFGLYLVEGMGTVLNNISGLIIDSFTHVGLQIADIFERARTLNFSEDTRFTPQLNTLANKSFSPLEGLGQMPQMSLMGIAGNANKAFDEGMNEFFERSFNKRRELLAKDKNVANTTTNIGKVEIRQDFKENMEPDRIASSIMKTLTAVAMNPTQAAGGSLSAAQAGGGVR